jgi:prepilin-type processing-associated H-X9-DG protein
MKRGFTVVELLAVVGLVALLTLLMFPGVQRIREYGTLGQCAHNLKMLVTANALYAADHGYYVAAAEDIHHQNLTRWHGRRSSLTEPFDGFNGPLSPYIGYSRTVRRCGAFRARDPAQHADAFESACGGYGYNDRGVGSRAYVLGHGAGASAKGMQPGLMARPSRTIMFADTAFPQPYGAPTHLIEYSFAEAYHFVGGTPEEGVQEVGQAMPSIHFRHAGRANIAWSDGHVSAERLETEYNATFTEMRVGWPGGANNDLFRPF